MGGRNFRRELVNGKLINRNRPMGTEKAVLVDEKIWGTRVRNAGEESVLIYCTFEVLGGVFWPLIL